MRLIDLITYFRHGESFEDFCREQSLNTEAEVIEIYAQKPVSLESQLGFFPIEETEGQAEFLSDDIEYQTLFDFFYFLDFIRELKENETTEDAELAQILLSYALNDA